MKENGENSFPTSTEDIEHIITLINEANQLEFAIYKSIPELKNTVKLKDNFTHNGTGLKLIKAYIDGALRNGRKLRIPGSFFEIIDLEIINVSHNTAEVRTEEKWRLLWYKSDTNKNDVIYDVLNEQKYYLKKVKEKWKIHHNNYSGKLEKIVD